MPCLPPLPFAYMHPRCSWLVVCHNAPLQHGGLAVCGQISNHIRMALTPGRAAAPPGARRRSRRRARCCRRLPAGSSLAAAAHQEVVWSFGQQGRLSQCPVTVRMHTPWGLHYLLSALNIALLLCTPNAPTYHSLNTQLQLDLSAGPEWIRLCQHRRKPGCIHQAGHALVVPPPPAQVAPVAVHAHNLQRLCGRV